MHNTRPIVYQINLSPSLGGAEVFTGFFSRALSECGWPNELIVSSLTDYWQRLDIGCGKLIPFVAEDKLASSFPKDAVLVIHSSVPESLLKNLSGKVRLIALAHSALYNDRQPAYYRYAEMLIPVSKYVAETLEKYNYSNIYPLPLYGIGSVKPSGTGPIVRGVIVDWDQRKLRDRVLSAIDRVSHPLRKRTAYLKRPGLTLGIVSRLADAKQFPLLLSLLAQQIKGRPGVWLEVFGSAVGFRALKNFRSAVAPIADRVRYWGFQSDVGRAYASIDYLITGLPEQEALGLNVIEAQMCGTPVIAPRAAPFTETVVDGRSGFLYRDPREDNGKDFARVLDEILRGGSPPLPLLNSEHLLQFEFPAFCSRIDEMMKNIFSRRS